MPKKKELTTKRGQYHKFKTFVINLIKDVNIAKIGANVVRNHPESFEKRKVTFEKRNEDETYFREMLCREFPFLIDKEFSLWRLSKDKPILIELPSDINNAAALCNYEELNRSRLYIRLQATSLIPCPSSSTEPQQMSSSDPNLTGTAIPYTAPSLSSAIDSTQGVQSVVIMAKDGKSGNLVSQGTLDIATVIGPDGQPMFQPLQPPSATQAISSSHEVIKDDHHHQILDTSSGVKSFRSSDNLLGNDTKYTSWKKNKRRNLTDEEDNQLETKRHQSFNMHGIQENPSTESYAYAMDNDNVQPMSSFLFSPEGMVYDTPAMAGRLTDFYDSLQQNLFYPPTVDTCSDAIAASSNFLHLGSSSQSDTVMNSQNHDFVPEQPNATDAFFRINNSNNSLPMSSINHELQHLSSSGATEHTSNTLMNQYSSILESAQQQPTRADHIPEKNINPGNGDQTDTIDDEDKDDDEENEDNDDDEENEDNDDDEKESSKITKDPKAEFLGEFQIDSCVLDGTVLDRKIYLIYEKKDTVSVNRNIKPFRQEGEIKVNGMKFPRSISACAKSNCLYISDGYKDVKKVIWLVKVGDEMICEKFLEDVECCSLSSTRDGELFLLDSKNNCVHFYRPDGRCFRCVKLPKVENFDKPKFVIASLRDDFYISSSPFIRREKRLRFSSSNSFIKVETGSSIVYKLSSYGDIVKTFGGKVGSGPGQLGDSLHPLALDKHGRVIVGDRENERIILLDSDLQFLTTLIEDYTVFSNILFCDDTDNIFFDADFWHPKIRAFNMSEFRRIFLPGTSDQVPSISPTAKDETLYLSSIFPYHGYKVRGAAALLDRIFILTEIVIEIYSAKNPFKEFYYENSGFSLCLLHSDFWDISADIFLPRLYVTDKGNRCVWSFGIDLIGKIWLTDIGSPYTLSVTTDGSVIIPSNKHRRIDIYDRTGQQCKRIEIGDESKILQIRHAVKLLNSEDELYAVCHGLYCEDFDDEYPANEVFIISSDGVILQRYGGQVSSKRRELNVPTHLTVVGNGDLFVADIKNNRVFRLNKQLQLQEVGMTKDILSINEPQRLCYDDSSGLLLVCNSKSVDVVVCSFEAKHRKFADYKVEEKKSSHATIDEDLCLQCEDAEEFEIDLPTVQLIDQMEDQMQKEKECMDVAVLHDCLYLIYEEVNTVYVHRSHRPFTLQRTIVIEGMEDPQSIEASFEHDCLYILGRSQSNTHKIWRLMSNGQTAEVFQTFDSGYKIRHISVAENGHLLVTLQNEIFGYKFGCDYVFGCALYKANGSCTEYKRFYIEEENFRFHLGIKSRKCGIITHGAFSSGFALSKMSHDGTLLPMYGPFSCDDFFCLGMSLGGEGEILVYGDAGSIRMFDHHGRFVGNLLSKDDHNLKTIEGFSYEKDKKRLWICGPNRVCYYQLSEKKDKRSEGKTALSKKDFVSHIGGGNWGQLQYCRDITEDDLPVRSIARLAEKTYLLFRNEVSVHFSTSLRTVEDVRGYITIPEMLTSGRETDLWDIAASSTDHCLYITDRNGKCVWSVTLDHKIKKWLENIGPPYTLSVSDDGYVCILDNHYKKLNIYDASGSLKKSILLPRHMMYPLHSVQTHTGNFIISWATKIKSALNDDRDDDCDDDNDDDDDDDDNYGHADDAEGNVICNEIACHYESNESNLACEISEDGKVLRTFNRHISSPTSKTELCTTVPRLVKPCHLALDAEGRVFVADCDHGGRVLLLNPQLQFMEHITENFLDDDYRPTRLCYDKYTKDLLIIERHGKYDSQLKCIKMS